MNKLIDKIRISMKSAVITGASTGIGLATSTLMIEKGYLVFGSVRSESDANKLQRALGKNFVPLIFDVRDDSGIRQAVGIVRDVLKGNTLSVLINNAGVAVSGPMQFVPMDQMKEQLDINVLGLLSVTQQFLPLLGGVEEKVPNPGRIINISSVSGRLVTPFMGPYCASKFAVEAMSDALRRELSLYGIKVIVVQPGPIKTEIWRKAKEDNTSYPNTIFDPYLKNKEQIIDKRSSGALPVEQVAELLLKATEHPSPNSRYLITARSWIIKLVAKLPDRVADSLLLKMMKPSGD